MESELKDELWAGSSGPGFEFHLYCHPELVYTSPWEPIVLLPPPLASETVGGAGGGDWSAAPTPALRTGGGVSPRSQRAQIPPLGRPSQARSPPSRGRARIRRG